VRTQAVKEVRETWDSLRTQIFFLTSSFAAVVVVAAASTAVNAIEKN